MALPEYIRPAITLERLTDEAIDHALECSEFHVPTDIAKEAVYQWLGHSSVWNEKLDVFEQALLKGHGGRLPYPYGDALDVIQMFSAYVQKSLQLQDMSTYQEKLSLPAIRRAAEKMGLKDLTDEDINILSIKLSAYAVGLYRSGFTSESQEHLTEEQVEELAAYYDDMEEVKK